MSRSLLLICRVVLLCAVVTLACSIPTTVCGCSPARSIVFVRGSLTGADGQTIAGARLYFDGVPTSQSTILPVYASGPPNAETDVDGEFRALVYSTFSPGALLLRAAVVQPGLPDTVRITVGSATFRFEHEQPDTVAVTLRLPETRR